MNVKVNHNVTIRRTNQYHERGRVESTLITKNVIAKNNSSSRNNVLHYRTGRRRSDALNN